MRFKKLRFRKYGRKKKRGGRRLRRRFGRKGRAHKAKIRKDGLFCKDAALAKLRYVFSTDLQFAANAGVNACGGIGVDGNCLQNVTGAIGGVGITLGPSTPYTTTPLGLKTYQLQYQYGRIYASKCKITLVPISSAGALNDRPYLACLVPVPSGTPASYVENYDAMTAFPYAKSKVLMPGANAVKPTYFKKFMTTRKIEGISKAEEEDTDYNFQNSPSFGSPSKIWQWYLLFNNFTGATTASVQNFSLHIEMTYYVKFYRRYVNIGNQ